MTDLTVRQARADDYEAVVAFTEDTWADREAADYVPDVFHEWVETDGSDQRTVVLEASDGADADIAGICQGLLLTDHEAWAQGMRVNPAFRGEGVSPRLSHAVFDWAADQGATVCRNLVFSWNDAGLGQSRAVGFEPVTAFRFVHPEADADAESPAEADGDHTVTEDPAAAWSFWQRSSASSRMQGLALHPDETWVVSELTREGLFDVADDQRVFAVQGADGTRAAGCRVRAREHESDDGETEVYAEYGFGAWAGVPAARTLLAAIRRDAAEVDADVVRMAIPETARHVSDAAYARANLGDAPEFVLEADLTGRD
jgi:GNAT superfamily N-acetyltransferase